MRECGLDCNKKCPYEGNDLSWVLRRGGCPVLYTLSDMRADREKARVGQQKGKGKKSKRAGKWKNYGNTKTTKKFGSLGDRLESAAKPKQKKKVETSRRGR